MITNPDLHAAAPDAAAPISAAPTSLRPREHSASAWRLPLLAIVVLGAALRLYHLGHESIWFDEAANIYLVKYLAEPARFLDPEYCNDAPLHVVLMSVWYRVVLAIPGVDEGSVLCDYLLRLFPFFIGVASIVLVFVVARTITRRDGPSLIAAFLFAISPFQIYYGQDLRAYPTHVLLNLVAVWLLIRALERNRPIHWIALALTLAAAIYNHFFMIWNVVVFNILFVFAMPWYWRRTPQWIACNLAVILLAAPALRMALYVSLVFDTAWEVWYPFPAAKLALITFKNFFAGYSPTVWAYQAMTLVCAALTALGVVAFRKERFRLVLLLTLGAGPILVSILYWQTKEFPYYTHRLMIFSAIPVYILIGLGAARLPERGWIARGWIAALGAITVLTIPALRDYYLQRLHPIHEHTIGVLYKPDNRGAAHFIRGQMQGNDVVAHRIRYTSLPFEYYLDGKQHVVELDERGVVNAMTGYPSIRSYEYYGTRPVPLYTVLGDSPRLWLVNSWWRPFDLEAGTEAMSAWMDAHAIRQLRRPFDGIEVFRYDTVHPATLGLQKSIVVDFGADQVPVYYSAEKRVIAQNPGELQLMLKASEREKSNLVLRFDALLEESAPNENLNRVAESDASNFGLFASFPATASSTARFEFVLENRSATAGKYSMQIFSSVEVVSAPDFEPEDRNSSLWRYHFQYPPSPGAPIRNRLAIVASMTEYTPQGKAIVARVDIPPGRYSAWARVKVANADRNVDSAHGTFSVIEDDGTARTAGVVVPVHDGLSDGWHWVPAGTFALQSRGATVRVAASNPEGLRRAEFHLDRVMILPANTTFAPQQDVSELPANGQRRFVAEVALRAAGRNRVDVEVFEPATGTFRNLNFYVLNQPVGVNADE